MGVPVVLTVCTGNVCRSPLLERLLQRHVDSAHGVGALAVHSAGTAALVDSGMDARSADLLRELGGDPSGFVARRLTSAMVSQADLVLTATRANRGEVVRLVPAAMRRTFAARELALLLAAVPDGELPRWEDPRHALRDLADRARAARGALMGVRPEDLDLVDPYRQSEEIYARLRGEIEQALPQLCRGLSGVAAVG